MHGHMGMELSLGQHDIVWTADANADSDVDTDAGVEVADDDIIDARQLPNHVARS